MIKCVEGDVSDMTDYYTPNHPKIPEYQTIFEYD